MGRAKRRIGRSYADSSLQAKGVSVTEPKPNKKSKCDKCGGKLYVANTNPISDPVLVSRQRRCSECDNRFTTYEITRDEYMRLKKLDEFFDTMKLMFRDAFVLAK